jgi:hypothetical protein
MPTCDVRHERVVNEVKVADFKAVDRFLNAQILGAEELREFRQESLSFTGIDNSKNDGAALPAARSVLNCIGVQFANGCAKGFMVVKNGDNAVRQATTTDRSQSFFKTGSQRKSL